MEEINNSASTTDPADRNNLNFLTDECTRLKLSQQDLEDQNSKLRSQLAETRAKLTALEDQQEQWTETNQKLEREMNFSVEVKLLSNQLRRQFERITGSVNSKSSINVGSKSGDMFLIGIEKDLTNLPFLAVENSDDPLNELRSCLEFGKNFVKAYLNLREKYSAQAQGEATTEASRELVAELERTRNELNQLKAAMKQNTLLRNPVLQARGVEDNIRNPVELDNDFMTLQQNAASSPLRSGERVVQVTGASPETRRRSSFSNLHQVEKIMQMLDDIKENQVNGANNFITKKLPLLEAEMAKVEKQLEDSLRENKDL